MIKKFIPRVQIFLCSVAIISIDLDFAVSAQTLAPYFAGNNNGQALQFANGSVLKAGPSLPAIAFTGTISVTANGSINNGILTVVQPNTTSPILLPYGALITGAGITTGTSIVGFYPGTNNYAITAPAGASPGVVATAEAMTATPQFTNNIRDTLSSTAPTYASGGCTAGTPAFAAGSTPYSWSFTNGTGTCGVGNTVTFTFPAAPTTWMCTAVSTLNGATDLYVATGAASTTAVVFTDYSLAGAAQNTKANDVITGSCAPH